MLWLGSALAAWAGPADEAGALLEAGWPESAVCLLDSWLGRDPEAALLRFSLAERLDDDEALQAVLTPRIVAALPWSTRDQAHLLLGRAALQRGEPDIARQHLESVFPDAAAYGEASLLLGDLAVSGGQVIDGLHAWRRAVQGGELGPGLLRIASTYEALDRPADAATYLSMIPEALPEWGPSRVRLAEQLVVSGAEGQALSVLLELGRAPTSGPIWAPTAELLRGVVWQVRCQRLGERCPAGGADPERSAAQREALGVLLLQLRAALGTGSGPSEAFSLLIDAPADPALLPEGWVRSWRRRPEVAPLLLRLERIEAELVEVALAGEDALVAALAARRGATVAALGAQLRLALEQEIEALSPWAEGSAPQQLLQQARSRPSGPLPRCGSLAQSGRSWPIRGEIWADEAVQTVRCR